MSENPYRFLTIIGLNQPNNLINNKNLLTYRIQQYFQCLRARFYQLKNYNFQQQQIMTTVHPQSFAHQEMHQKYDADMIPPDWELAQNHSQACRPGRIIPEKTEVCPCCVNYIQKAQIPYWQDNKELAFLGDGFPLFYNFLKFCMIMLCIIIFDNCAMQILFNVETYDCTQDLPDFTDYRRRLSGGCSRGISTQVSTITLDPETNQMILLKVISFVAQIFILLYFRQQQSTLANYLDQRNTNLSDYVLYLDDIPQGLQGYRGLLNDLVDKLNLKLNLKESKDRLQLKQVLIIEDLQDHYILQNQLQQIVKLKKKAYKDQAAIREIQKLNQKYEQTQTKIVQTADMMEKNQEKYFLGAAFLTFNTEIQKNKAIIEINRLTNQQIKQIFTNYIPGVGDKLVAKQAPEPKQVNWENIHFTHRQRYFAIFLGWLLYVIIFVVIFIGFFFLIKFKAITLQNAILDFAQDPVASSQELRGSIALSYILMISINIFNKFALAPIAHHISDHERHVSFSLQQYSFAMKYTIGMFFTTAIMTLVIEAYLFDNFSGQYGVIEEELFMFIFNAFFSPIMWLINPYHILVVIKKKLYYGSDAFTQREANKMLQYPAYDMGKRYAEVMKTMWFTFLYIQLIPAGAIFSLAGIFCYYVIDRYVLLRRSSVKQGISIELSTSMIRVLEFVLVLKPAGQLFYDYQIRNQIQTSSVVMIIIGGVFLFVPWDYLLQCFFNQDFFPEEKTYQQTKHLFLDNYASCYPIRKHKTHLKMLHGGKIKFKVQNNGAELDSPQKKMNISVTEFLITDNCAQKIFKRQNQLSIK